MATAPRSESTDNNFEKHPSGGTAMVCSRIIDKGSVFNQKDQSTKRKILIVFESSKLMESGEFKGEPFLLFANFNFSMYENAHLCKFVSAWLGQRFVDQNDADAFELNDLLGKPMFASVVINGEWVNVESPMPLPEGMAAPTVKGKKYSFFFEAPSLTDWNEISDGMKEKMMQTPEYKEWINSPIPSPESEAPPSGMSDLKSLEGSDIDSDIPF